HTVQHSIARLHLPLPPREIYRDGEHVVSSRPRERIDQVVPRRLRQYVLQPHQLVFLPLLVHRAIRRVVPAHAAAQVRRHARRRREAAEPAAHAAAKRRRAAVAKARADGQWRRRTGRERGRARGRVARVERRTLRRTVGHARPADRARAADGRHRRRRRAREGEVGRTEEL
ncbi:uncharacterized protein RHOBADRAFT_65845, partial [Rhodotorula graminis WP1]